MPNQHSNLGTAALTDRLKLALARDPRKAAVLGVLLVVLCGVVLRFLSSGSTLPRSARAAAISPDAKGEIVEGAKQRARSLSAEDDLEKFLASGARPMERNLFDVKLDYFPADPAKSRQTNGTRPEKEKDDEIAKSLRNQADQQSQKEVLIANLRQQALQLKLQSIVMGSTPRAVINGELLGEGDVIASFRVLRIEARRIIVEREGVRLEITMK